MGGLIHLLRDKITKNLISLEKYGIHNLAWSKVDAQQLIHLIDKDKIGIFGVSVKSTHIPSR